MIVSINQPAYLPWLGYFDRVKRSDFHIVLDHVQLEKGGFTNRTRIRQRDGRVMWLTVPVEKGWPIKDTLIASEKWRRKHREALTQAYGCVGYPRSTRLMTISAVCYDSLLWCWGQGLPRSDHVFSSALGGGRLGHKSDLVLNLCREVGATTYLSGPNGRNYLDIPAFEQAGIEVLYHDFPAEQPVLSALDYLFRSTAWPQAHLTSAHSSPPLVPAGEAAAPA